MRADLHTLEKIDQYLTGKMSGAALTQFKSELETNPELQSLVNDQQIFIQTVNRKALLAEIHVVAGVGATPWYANPWAGVAGVVVVAGIVAGSIYLAGDEPQPEPNKATETAFLQTDTTSSETINYNDIDVADSTSNYFITSTQDDHVPVVRADKNNLLSPTPLVCDDGEVSTENQFNDGQNSGDQLNQHDQYQHTDITQRNRKASYPEGLTAMNEFIDKYMRYPGTAKEKNLSGNVRVKFLVTNDGQRTELDATCFVLRDENDKPLTNTQFVFNQKIAHLFERESERIIRIMPLWVPATDSSGNPILTAVEIYFNFSLKEGISMYQIEE